MKNLILVLLVMMFAIVSCTPLSDYASTKNKVLSMAKIQVEHVVYHRSEHSGLNELYVMDNNGICYEFCVSYKYADAVFLQKGDSLYFWEKETYPDSLKIVFKR